MSYHLISRIKVARDYRETAIGALKQIKEIHLANGASGVRQGIIMTGSGVNMLMNIQIFDNMVGIESSLEATRKAPITTQTMASGKFEFFGRSILKGLVSIGTPGSTNAKFIVFTMANSEHPIEDEATEFAKILAENGAISGRLAKFVMGDYADGQTYLLGMAYPSLSAVQSAYDAVPADIADKVYKLASVQRRQLIRLF